MAHREERLAERMAASHALVMANVASSDPPNVRAPRDAAHIVVPLAAAASLVSGVSAAVALLLGIAVALTFGNPWPSRTRAFAHKTLTWSVVGLGAGMNLVTVAHVGVRGIGYTAVGIGTALALGTLLGRRLGVGRDASLLVTVGTAICGGSAIAAIAPAIGAKESDVSVALVTIFLLNAIALFLFPSVGHALHLSEDAFGLWCALAIHDTSSVVGAAAHYGPRALEVATAAKLARALWIVPLTFAVAALRDRTRAGHSAEARTVPKRPWFIAGFLAAAALATFVPGLRAPGALVAAGAHRVLALTLFLIGSGLSRSALRSIGARPLLQAVALWIVLAGGALGAIRLGWIA